MMPTVTAILTLSTTLAGSDTPLFRAIAHVESNTSDKAVGDGGRARGRYQIHKGYWNDALEYAGYKPEDYPYMDHVRDAESCRVIMQLYWARYGAESDEERCRQHNGGPRGMEKESTKAYWKKVQAAMKGNKDDI